MNQADQKMREMHRRLVGKREFEFQDLIPDYHCKNGTVVDEPLQRLNGASLGIKETRRPLTGVNQRNSSELYAQQNRFARQTASSLQKYDGRP